MKVVAAILAAGRGERFGADKVQVELNGKPLWRWSFDAFRQHPQVTSVGLVGSESNLAALRTEEAAFVILGGSDRRESSRKAVEASSGDMVLIHDAARPFVSARLISDVISAIGRSGAAGPGLPMTDTVKRLEGNLMETVDRRNLYTVQTPQGGRRELFLEAHAKASDEVTDDLGLFEAIGIVPELVPGDPENIKITTPADLSRYGRVISEVRTGMGYDVHPFSEDPSRPLYLGGVQFEGARGLAGHSDADALLHAAVDALLGAAALGDIGQLFPNTDSQWKDAPSSHFLRHAGQLLKEEGWTVQNLDLTVVAEEPKVMARSLEIRQNVASSLNIDLGRVNVKATTNERLGFIGRGEGIAAFATASLARR